MKILVVARYSWLRLARAHYIKALWAMCFFVFMAVSATNTSADTVAAKMGSVELGIRVARICVWLAAIWVGMSGLSGELSSFTARTLLTKPIRRFTAVMGILIGSFLFIVLIEFVLSAEIYVLAQIRGVPLGGDFFLLQFSALPAVFSLVALAQLLSILLPRPLTGFFMIGLSYEGFWDYFANGFEASEHNIISVVMRVIYLLSPTYSRFLMNYREFVKLAFPLDRWLLHSGSCILYAVVCCMITALVLQKKDI